MLGVIIGVASVVALISLGAGASASITGQVEALGTNLVFIVPGASDRGGPGSAHPPLVGRTARTCTSITVLFIPARTLSVRAGKTSGVKKCE